MESKKHEKQCKFERATQEQLKYFKQFCKQHPELQGGKSNPKASRRAMQLLWEQVAEQLNAMIGPTRTAPRWKDSLLHWKYQMRCRARKAKEKMKINGEDQCSPDMQTFDDSSVDSFPGVGTLGLEETTYQAPVSSDSDTDNKNDVSLLTAISEVSDSSLLIPLCAPFPALSIKEEEEDYTSLPASPEFVDSAVPSTSTRKISLETIFNATMKSIKAREEREERAIAQQTQMTLALQQMSQSMTAMSQLLAKFSEKLDRL